MRRSGVRSGDAPAGKRGCVYTVLLGGYEQLTEQPVADESGLDFVCFTDEPSLESETWSIRLVRPLLAHDAPRSQRALKIRAHAAVPAYDVSVYIDNSVLLKVPPEYLLAELLPADAGLAAIAHSFRNSVAAEFDAVVDVRLDLPDRCAEQREHYRLEDPASLELGPLSGGLLLRRHHQPAVAAAMDLWFQHVLRYSRRDQLSLRYCLRQVELEPVVLELDNRESAYHRWPIDAGRNVETLAWTDGEIELANAREALARAARNVELLRAEIRTMRESRSWRWTSRLRAAARESAAVQRPPSNASTSPEPSQDATSR